MMRKPTRLVMTFGLFFSAACGSGDNDVTGDTPGGDAAIVDVARTDTRAADVTTTDAPASDSTTMDVRSDLPVVDASAADSALTDSTSGDAQATDSRPDSSLLDAPADLSTPSDGRTNDSPANDASMSDSRVADAVDSAEASGADAASEDAGDGDVGSYLVTVTLAGDGMGTVTSSPAGIDCGSTCAASFDYAQSVTLTASPGTHSTFTGWSGGGCTGTGPCTVSVTTATTVTATFTLEQRALNVTKAGNGAGTVTSNPAGINCGATCAANFYYGQDVVLTASAGAGSTFTGWSGSGCAGTAPCTVPMTAASDVTATFTLVQYTLSVSKSGAGMGTVSSNPAGVDCGATCSADFNYGTIVSLYASSSTSAFMGWSGSCVGTGACSITMNSARFVSATFVPPLTCTTVSTASICTNGAIPEINLGPIASATCHDQCQIAMKQAGMTTGCWIFASNGNCYCRSGSLSGGGTRPGGSCN